MSRSTVRERRDLCPGVLRPWPAEDGALVRVRLLGGRISGAQLRGLSELAGEHGDGDLHLTSRANLQVRGLPASGGALDARVVDRIEELGLLPSRSHDLVRNVMVSPLTGLVAGMTAGRVDAWPVAVELERLLLADPRLAGLPGKFLFALDDGRGDLLDQRADLTAVALDDSSVQVRVGGVWGESTSLANAARLLVVLAQEFLRARGDGADAAWHVAELGAPLMPAYEADPRVPVATGPLPYDERHVAVPDGVLTPEQAAELGAHDLLVVTPWRGVVIR
ncbi:nitrite reductase [Nocardioides mangrovicus]|uniref:Nitrite reductase n=1 Tax=Nocardioides mangrovicus TaxID=2478913 RepID=A0A3L8P4K6_9ACTN|nr:nitrite reductase [Nocardioides mangrovicus]RLV50366.1 nitrite reductase [Nocardioides mangrovicus]